MGIFEAIILGLIQGLSEFLPVSSSGHLVLMQRIFGIDEPALFFDVMLHVGTLGAVLAVLWKDVWGLLRRPFQPLMGCLILGTIPTVIAALAFKGFIEQAFQSGAYLGFAFLSTALIIWVSELLSGYPRRSSSFFYSSLASSSASLGRAIDWLDALVIGLFQAVAIVPGVSRSGLTLSGAFARKLNRETAARFSFLLSIPAILGALALQLMDLFSRRVPAEAIRAAPIIAGTITAGVVGFGAVQFMLSLVRKQRLWGFAIYVGILGILVLIDQRLSHIFF